MWMLYSWTLQLHTGLMRGSGVPKAFYLTENGEHCWGELSQSTVEVASKLGLLSEAKAEVIDMQSAKKYAGAESSGQSFSCLPGSRSGSPGDSP